MLQPLDAFLATARITIRYRTTIFRVRPPSRKNISMTLGLPRTPPPLRMALCGTGDLVTARFRSHVIPAGQDQACQPPNTVYNYSMDTLTARQAEILRFIMEHTERTGMPPTRGEICTAMGFRSPNAAEEHLRALARKGAIAMTPGISRGIRLNEPAGLPIIGRVAAGSPLLAAEHIEGRCAIDPRLFKPRADYLLKVRGMSMRDAGILDGDLLAVHRTADFTSGQIVVARIADEVTVKRIYRRRSLIELMPENPEFQPIKVDPQRETLAIEGLAVGVIRAGQPL